MKPATSARWETSACQKKYGCSDLSVLHPGVGSNPLRGSQLVPCCRILPGSFVQRVRGIRKALFVLWFDFPINPRFGKCPMRNVSENTFPLPAPSAGIPLLSVSKTNSPNNTFGVRTIKNQNLLTFSKLWDPSIWNLTNHNYFIFQKSVGYHQILSPSIRSWLSCHQNMRKQQTEHVKIFPDIAESAKRAQNAFTKV